MPGYKKIKKHKPMNKLITIKKSILFIFIFLMIPTSIEAASSLTDKLNGKILLQIEGSGQAWYVYPGNKERAFLGRPADAFKIMRELGIGITENNYNSYNGYAPKKLSGKILLRVQAKGEAYYVSPDNLKIHYLGKPADAFRIMRELGLGVTNDNLNKIPVFQKYKEKNTKNINEDISINKLTINKIDVDMPIIVSDSEDEGLSKGAWILPDTSTPDKGGNTVISAHRWKYLPPSKKTFYLLDKVQTGDIISVIWEKETYYYKVKETKIVHKTGVHILAPSKNPVLTLFTCHPVYSTENRFVVIADLMTE